MSVKPWPSYSDAIGESQQSILGEAVRALADEGAIPPLAELARRTGYTRQTAMRVRNSLTARGLWPQVEGEDTAPVSLASYLWLCREYARLLKKCSELQRERDALWTQYNG